MDVLEQKIFDLIKKKSGISLEEIKREIISYEEEIELIKKCLDSLEAKGLIHRSKNGFYSVLSVENGVVAGTVIISASKKTYVITKDNRKIRLSENDATGLLPGDFVMVSGVEEGNKGHLTGKLNKILKRKHEQICCEVISEDGENKLVSYNGNRKRYIKINERELSQHGIGEILLVRLFTSVNNEYDGECIKTVGHIDEPDVDEKTIAYDHGFEIDFSPAALKELKRIPTHVNSEKHVKEGRRDLRDKVMFTIDGSDTKDIDDSIGMEILHNGNYKLYVNIADVGYYIKEGTALFEDIYNRGTSVYMNDTVIPMIPHKISNGICSLHPHVDRLTKTCEMIINKDGKVVDYDIYDSIINSKKKMTYEDVNKILIDGEMVEGYEDFEEQLVQMNKLSKILESQKLKRGYINFSRSDLKACGKGSNIYFNSKTQRDAEKLIENFMLVTNETVAQHVFYRGLPFIYRIHEAPDEESVKEYLSTLFDLGIKFKKCREITSHKYIQSIAETLQNQENNSDILSELLLINTMKKAKYASINIGHFGLALHHYTHFTSPIRRFADLMVHKLLNFYKNFDKNDYSELENYLSVVAKQCTNRSNEAEKAEREARQMRIAEYLSHNIGSTYKGTVTYVTQSSLKVKTEEGFYGDISISDLVGGHFKYNSKNNTLVCLNTNITYKVGSLIEVSVKDASKKNRMVMFTNGQPIKIEQEKTKIKKRN